MSKKKTMWFRMSAEKEPPSLVAPAIGFDRVVVRHGDSYRMQVTVLDSADARLLRSGIVVAHRRKDDQPGEWYVSSPHWPGIPDEASYELDQTGDLPAELGNQLHLFLRNRPLLPFATMDCQRREYTLRGADEDLVKVRDDEVLIYREEEIFSASREVSITPLKKLDSQQRDFILTTMNVAEAEVLDEAPTLQQRIGPPATGLATVRTPRGLKKSMTLEDFVAELFLSELHGLLLSELEKDHFAQSRHITKLRTTLRGLSAVLEPNWRSDLEQNLQDLESSSGEERETILLDVIDSLVSASRAPRLGNLSRLEARCALYPRIEQAVVILFDRCRALRLDSADEAWTAVLKSAAQLEALASVAEPLFPKQITFFKKTVADLLLGLKASVSPPEDLELSDLTPEDAFKLGRDYEYGRWVTENSRRKVLKLWPKKVKSGHKALMKMRKKLP